MSRNVIRGRARAVRLGLVVSCILVAAAIGGVPLVDSGGEVFRWDLDTAQPNVIAGRVTFYVDPDGTSDSTSGPQSDLAAVRNGVKAWEVTTSRLRFQEDASRSANGRDGGDRVNWIGWVNSGLGRFTFAATFPTRSGSDILDMDVLFNDADFAWDTRSPGLDGVADIQALMAHEWGHAIGLDHIPLRASTMYFSADPGSTYFRSLSADDRAVTGSVYPNAVFDQTTGSIVGNVTRSDRTNHLAIHVVAISLVTGEPAGSTLTGPDGDFRLAGLPGGAYYVVASPTVPLDALNAYWTAGRTDFVPSVLRVTDDNPAAAAVALVTAGQDTPVAAFTVRNDSDVFEFDDGLGSATPIEIGDAVGARLEGPNDQDWFSFQGTAGERVSIWVYAWHLGSEADAKLTLTNAAGSTVAEQDDVRSSAQFRRQPEGADLDARLSAVRLDNTGTYYVRVASQGGFADPDRFYVLFVTPASEAPSPALTMVTATPLRIDADGTATSVITVHPVRGTGEDVGAGETVTVGNDGAGDLSEVIDQLDGTYSATLTAPVTPGVDHISVTVTNADGTASIPDALRIVYLGPPNASTTARTLLPRRISIGGAAGTAGVPAATLTMWPRDASGEDLGPGRRVDIAAQGDLGVGPVADNGEGEYAAALTGGGTPGAIDIGVTIDGVALGTLAVLHVGFPLDEVLAQADLDVRGFQDVGDLPKSARSQLARAARKIAAGLAKLSEGNVKRAVSSAKAAAAKVDKATSKSGGALPSLGTVPELAQTVRETAVAAIAAVSDGATSSSQAKRIARAQLLVSDGDVLFGQGDVLRAASRWKKAYGKVAGLLP